MRKCSKRTSTFKGQIMPLPSRVTFGVVVCCIMSTVLGCLSNEEQVAVSADADTYVLRYQLDDGSGKTETRTAVASSRLGKAILEARQQCSNITSSSTVGEYRDFKAAPDVYVWNSDSEGKADEESMIAYHFGKSVVFIGGRLYKGTAELDDQFRSVVKIANESDER